MVYRGSHQGTENLIDICYIADSSKSHEEVLQEGVILREMLDTVEKRDALTALLEQERQRCGKSRRPAWLMPDEDVGSLRGLRSDVRVLSLLLYVLLVSHVCCGYLLQHLTIPVLSAHAPFLSTLCFVIIVYFVIFYACHYLF